MFNFSGKGKNYFKGEIEPHEVLLDKLAKRQEERWGISERKLEVPILRPLQVIFYFSIMFIFILFLRTFQLQVVEGKYLSSQAQANRYVFHKIQAQRGVIYDRHFQQLVYNQEIFNLVCEKNKLPKEEFEREKVLALVAQILKKNKEELQKKIEEGGETFLVAENLDHKSLIILETKIKELPGFEILRSLRRNYFEGEYFSHLLGYLGKIDKEELEKEPEMYSTLDYVGKAGIEKSFEKILRKTPGKTRIERDALGNVISQEVISFPKTGKSLVLWLDASLQKKIYELLQKRLQEIGSKKAAAVALNPQNGGVVALLSIPSYNNNIFSSGDIEQISGLLRDKNEPLFNRAIAGEYVMGSLIKPLIALAALEEKIIDPLKKINCLGQIVIPNPWEPTLPTIKKDWKTHGWTDLKKAIAESCNVYFYTVGGGLGEQVGLGVRKIKHYLELFGWGQPTGIDLFGEATGLIPDPEWKASYFKDPQDKIWRDGDTYNLSIGQGFILASPLQIATVFSAIANGGILYQPQLIQQVVDTSTNPIKIIEEIKPKIIRENFIDSQNLRIVREGMRQAVTGENSPSATAKLLDDLPVSAGAKTGTAEVWKEKKKMYHTWVTVFAPYENPEIVLTLVIEDVREREIEHQLTVLPVAKEILDWYFRKTE